MRNYEKGYRGSGNTEFAFWRDIFLAADKGRKSDSKLKDGGFANPVTLWTYFQNRSYAIIIKH